MSCAAPTSIPSPPTTLPSCAVPIGGSNSSILDTCCNAHVNAMLTYSAPASASNSRADNGCFQFCITDDPAYVAGCLTNTLGEYEGSALLFECFNTGEVEKGRQEDGARGGGPLARLISQKKMLESFYSMRARMHLHGLQDLIEIDYPAVDGAELEA
ncbi:hypothetical protein BDU57DRAFT_539184 [Ampelomyces quisqualis]|uniref:Uncharacterized protein n=1 Tax=Ampelomyces quisqualis TaxID=50730 RepID=A0A6A5QSM9_AMPQU|nr:hypothetical protein BDU57DRAFT_539184 [Ampelomyces quisqualis]